MKPQDEIIKYFYVDCNTPGHIGEETLTITLGTKELKLLKELHGTIGLDEFMRELSDKIKGELNGCIN